MRRPWLALFAGAAVAAAGVLVWGNAQSAPQPAVGQPRAVLPFLAGDSASGTLRLATPTATLTPPVTSTPTVTAIPSPSPEPPSYGVPGYTY